jgi:histidinol-phosphate aminotransferase
MVGKAAMPIAKDYLRAVPSYSISETVEDIVERYQLDSVVYLASNENPMGCSPTVADALAQAANESHRYPDGSGLLLKQAIASKFDLAIKQVMLGNGSNEILDSIAKAYLGPGDELLVSDHSFAMYPIFAKCVGATVRSVPMKNWFVDLDAISEAITANTRVIFIANANNPTGTMLSLYAVEDFVSAVPTDVLVVIDEAYIEFADDNFSNALPLLSRFPNVFICRTFSKAYGLAGFRVGYGLGHSEVVGTLEKICQPFNVNLFAQKAAIAALQDDEFLAATVNNNAIERSKLSAFLIENGIDYLPSQTNFVAVCFPQLAESLYQFLLQQGVIIRRLSSYQMSDWLRVSIGNPEENARLIEAIQQFLEN